jgi:hypothetical protein
MINDKLKMRGGFSSRARPQEQLRLLQALARERFAEYTPETTRRHFSTAVRELIQSSAT